MKKKIFTIFITIFIVISINIWSFYKFSPKLFPERNLVLVEKTEKILNSGNLFKEKKPEKIISKGIFIKKNLVLTVAHGVDSFEDDYKINLKNNFFNAKLIKKDLENDFAILETKKKIENFWNIEFGKISEKDFIFYFKDNDFERLDIKKIENNKIFVKNIFQKWESWTIFYNYKKQIVGILTEYDLDNKIWIINILDKKKFQ